MYHKFLEKQINKHLPEHLLGLDEVKAFLESINNSYTSFERDKEISEHAFKISEKEFDDINFNLKAESELRKTTIENLKSIVGQLVENDEVFDKEHGDDLIYISNYIKKEVSKRQVAEDSLNRTINLFKTLLANLQSGVLVENENREILFTNQIFCDLFSIPAPPDLLVGADCSSSAEQSKHLFLHPELFVSNVNKILENKAPIYNEFLEMADGRFLERDYVPIVINNQYKGHLWQYTDVTERVKNQRMLEESEERSRLIMDSALDAIVISDSEGHIRYWSPRAEEIFGWTSEEVFEKSMTETFIPGSMRGAHQSGMKRYNDTGVPRILNQRLELEAVNKEGDLFPVELTVINFMQNGKKYFCGFLRNISARKNAENLLKSQEEKYRNIIANMNLGLVEVDNEENILFANQSFCDISGYSLEELISTKAPSLFLDDDIDRLLSQKRALRGQGVSDNYEMKVKNKQGEERWWFISGAPQYNDKNEMIGSIGIHLDITKQKKLEKELEKAKNQAEEAAKSKDVFLANMSHEIRTPLNVIIGMIRELTKENLTPIQAVYVSNSASAAQHLLTILNNILDISKIEAGELVIENKDFSVSALASNVISILHSKALEKSLEFNVEIAPEIKSALIGDSGRIGQILINLIGNAIKFTEKGSIELLITVLESNEEYQKLSFEVCDTGIGMSEKFLKQIFKKFSQEEDSANRRFEGSGLGMAITKEMILLMGGTISVESKKGIGTSIIFELTFPIGDENKLSTTNNIIEKNSLKNVKILLVEDNDMNRFIALQSLEHFGCKTTEAENGMIAIEKLKQGVFDLVLMDIQMPEMDGVEATGIIRNQLKLNVPIVALTANAFKHDIDKYLSIGMNDYILKPYNEDELYRKIEKYTQGIDFESEEQDVANSGETKSKLYDLKQLNDISHGKKDFVRKMLTIFVDLATQTSEQLKEAYEKGDISTINKLAHKIKPSIDSMGIVFLHDRIRMLERFSLENDSPEELNLLLNTVVGTLLLVVEGLKNDELKEK